MTWTQALYHSFLAFPTLPLKSLLQFYYLMGPTFWGASMPVKICWNLQELFPKKMFVSFLTKFYRRWGFSQNPFYGLWIPGWKSILKISSSLANFFPSVIKNHWSIVLLSCDSHFTLPIVGACVWATGKSQRLFLLSFFHAWCSVLGFSCE